MCLNYKLLCSSKASAAIQQLRSQRKAPLRLTGVLSVQLRATQPQVPPKRRARPAAPTLVALAGDSGCIPPGAAGTCPLRLACRNAHPEHLCLATFCNEGSSQPPDSLPRSDPTVCNPLFIRMTVSARGGRNLYDFPPTQFLPIPLSKNEAAPLEPVSSVSLQVRGKEK